MIKDPALLDVYMLFMLHLGENNTLSMLYYDDLYEDAFGWGPKDIWIIIPDKNLKIKINISNELRENTLYYDNTPVTKDVYIITYHYVVEPFKNKDGGFVINCSPDECKLFHEMIDCLKYIYSQ